MAKEFIIKNHKISGEHATICVPIVERKYEDIIESAKKCQEANVPMVEFRADFFDGLRNEKKLEALLKDLAQIFNETVLLFTIRTSDEGGEISIDTDDYKKILLKVSRSGHVDMIDCELDKVKRDKNFFGQLKENGVVTIASHHNFSLTYDEEKIISLYEEMDKAGADILKLALMPECKADVFELLSAAEKFTTFYKESLIVAISMGSLGKASRVLSGFVGSCITFSSIEKASAPGQIGFTDMKTLLEILDY